MRSDSFGKVTISTNNNSKKSKFNWSHDCNTSYDWGSVQPILSKFMLPDSSINVNMEQLTRLAPMVVPTFGRVKLKNSVHFVSIREIFPNFDYFLSHTPVNRPQGNTDYEFIPQVLPHINSSILTAFCLAGSKFNLYIQGATDNQWTCYRNNGTNANPDPSAPINGAVTLARFLFGYPSSGSPLIESPYNLTSLNYNGYCMSFWKFTTGSYPRGFAVSDLEDDFCFVPSMTTLYPVALDSGSSVANGYTHSFTRTNNIWGQGADDYVSMEGADLIWESPVVTAEARAAGSGSVWQGFGSSYFDGKKVRITFKLSSFGKRLRKVLIGLGYNFSLTDSSEVSLLPLLAYYKAWWDSYAPQRVKSFYMTDCWRLIQLFTDGNVQCDVTSFISDETVGANMRLYLKRFIFELGSLFATERMDAISAATDKMILDSNISGQLSYSLINDVLKEYDSIFGTSQHTGIMEPSLEGSNPNKVFGLRQNDSGVNATLQQPQLDALKKAYTYMNKRSVAGKVIGDILRMQGQGKYVEECQGKFVAASEEGIKISDVVATAATEDATLGQYGGRGLGVTADQFSYSTDYHGYLFMISCVVPESGYVNAPDLQNEVIDYTHFFNPEFDGFNYEAVLKKQVVGSPLVNVCGDNHANDTFGFLPTYSKFKFTSNKANGDFSLNSMKASYRPYTLDKYVPVNDVSVSSKDIVAGAESVLLAPRFGYDSLPNAGEDYRYINKYPFVGDYNRIFKAEGDSYNWVYLSQNDNGFLYNSFEYDNFLTHNVFKITYTAPMKAIEDSYSTYDEDSTGAKGGITRS